MPGLLHYARQLAGVLAKDWRRYVQATASATEPFNGTDRDWVRLCNRIEALEPNPDGRGVRCLWQDGSDLHAPSVLPDLGRRLFDAALADWPIRFAEPAPHSANPEVTFVFAHGGRERLPLLQCTLRSVFAQRDVDCECLVIEQGESRLANELPAGVRSLRLTKDGVPDGWHKAWAFNVAARQARGKILVFQDGDVCVPERYASELRDVFRKPGVRAASLQRLLFYLDEAATRQIVQAGAVPTGLRPVRVLQNCKGGTIAVEREAFFELGGFDEGFVDWGGEDDEFYDRCRLIGHCRYGYLPFVHLWHPPQPDRKTPENINTAYVLPERLKISAEDRVRELCSRAWGRADGPDPRESYKSRHAKASGGCSP